MTQTWYAVRTEARREREAAASIRERRLDVFLPCETRLRRTAKGPTTVHNPLLPGYLFVGTNGDTDASAIYGCAGLSAVVGVVKLSSGVAAVIPSAFVNGLRASIAAGDFDYTPRRLPLTVGGQVQITAGPFQGMIASLVAMPSKGRAKVLIGAGLFAGPASVDARAIKPTDEARGA